MHPRLVVPSSLQLVAATQDGVVTGGDVRAAGAPSWLPRSAVRSGLWTPLLPGAHLVQPGATGRPLERAWARSAVLLVRGAVLGGSTAAVLHGVQGVPRTGRVHVLVDREVQATKRLLVVARGAPRPDELVDLAGLPVTSVLRTLVDLVPHLDRLSGLAVLDSALHLGLVDAAGLQRAVRLSAGRRGAGRLRELVALADGRAESPLESRVRLLCLDAGLVPCALQLVVRTPEGVFVARSDLAFHRHDPRLPPLLLEADGVDAHSAPAALLHDRSRANALVALGHPVVRCTWADTCDPEVVPAMVRAAL